MTDFQKLLILGKVYSRASLLRLFTLFVLIALFLPLTTYAQAEFFKCPEREYKFVGTPQQTLCNENPNFVCQTQIGVGTPFPKSSLWGPSITGNVCIIGDFEIDAPFTFQTAVVKINSGVTIAIKQSPNGIDPGSSLVIDNSKLFACTGLWKGITLGHLSSIGTQNHSEIEDAETAIRATGLCALFIQQTIFNRDRIGIELVTPFPSVFVPGPLIWTFSDNHFTCDAPLNGTVDEISTAGVKLKNSFLSTSSGTNNFTDIQYGIYSEGNASYIGCQNLIFQRIRHDGIYMEQGNINLRASQFLNGYEKGIHIITANNVTVSNNCNFTWDNNLPLKVPGSDPNFYYGLHIEKFALGSLTNVANTLFSADITNGLQRVIGTWFEGADVAGGTAITMTHNTWQMYGGAAIGVLIGGDFPSMSQIDIYNNDFDFNGHLNAGSPIGISSNGVRFNFDIIGNRFYSSPPLNLNSAPTGIDLKGSDGGFFNNDVSDNHWEQGTFLYSYLCAINVRNYTNTVYCSNVFANNNRSFCFSGANDPTFLTDNIAHGSQLIMLYDQSWIDDQNQMGNQWTAEYQGVPLAEWSLLQAECMGGNYASFSEFFVHTAQSTAYTGSGFNPYHPKDLFPDNTIEWWIQANGTPAMDCIGEIVNPGNGDSKVKQAVADGSLAAQFNNNPSLIWQAQRSLYFALKRNPTLQSENSNYSAFITAQTGSNIDKFYQVFAGIDAAKNGSASLVSAAQNNQTAISNLLILIGADDSAWQNAATTMQKESAQNSKKQHLGELMQLLYNCAGLQTSHKQNLQTSLANIQQINNSVTPVGDWEIYEKAANSILISFLHNEGMTESQEQQLETIAAVCPKYGGMAVFRARSILPQCAQSFDYDNYASCYPTPTLVETVELRSVENKLFQKVEKAAVQPNPTNGAATLSISDGMEGSFQIVNALGQVVVSTKKITASQTDLNLNMIPSGSYIINIEYSDGKKESLKLIVTR